MQGVSLTHPVLASFIFSYITRAFSFFIFYFILSGEFLLHFQCWLHFYVGSFSCISTHPKLALVGSGDFDLHIPCWFHFYRGSFSYTSLASFIFMWGDSLTHPVLASFLSGEFLLHLPCWLYFSVGSFSYTSRAGFIFIWGVSLKFLL